MINEKNFYDIVGRDKHVMVEFFADYCIWCKRMAPEFELLAQKYMGPNPARKDVVIAKINGQDCPNLSHRYKVKSYPKLVFFRKGSTEINGIYEGDRKHRPMSEWIEHLAGPEEETVNENNQKLTDSVLDRPELDASMIPNPVPENKNEVPKQPYEEQQQEQQQQYDAPAANQGEVNDKPKKDSKKGRDNYDNNNNVQKYIDYIRTLEEKIAALEIKINSVNNNVNGKIQEVKEFIVANKREQLNMAQQHTQSLTELKEGLKQLAQKDAATPPVETGINFFHGIIFVILGGLVGVGITFTMINLGKINKKKKFLLD